MKRGNKKVARFDSLISPELLKQAPADQLDSIKSLMTSSDNLRKADETNARSSLRLVALCIRMIGKPDLPEIKMAQSIINQIPNAQYN